MFLVEMNDGYDRRCSHENSYTITGTCTVAQRPTLTLPKKGIRNYFTSNIIASYTRGAYSGSTCTRTYNESRKQYTVILKDYLLEGLGPPQLLSSIRLWLVLFVSTHYSILSNAQDSTYGIWRQVGCLALERSGWSVGSYISDWKDLDSRLEYR
jgi:hypothetical protein